MSPKRAARIVAILLISSGLAAPAARAAIRGNYLETRTADVYVGSCFANSEVGTAGKEAILAWKITEGDWHGVRLDGLSVVAVVRASATLGDPHAAPEPVHALVFVDARGTARQRRSLAAFARETAGDLLSDVVEVRAETIEAVFGAGVPEAHLRVGSVAEVHTRALSHHDHLCAGNTELTYPPLIAVDDFQAVFTQIHRFGAQGLGGTWSSPDKSSAFVASFTR